MRKNKKSCSISEFCRNNNFRTLEFYKMLSRHPELARKMKANSAGERVLDEEAMMTAKGIHSAFQGYLTERRDYLEFNGYYDKPDELPEDADEDDIDLYNEKMERYEAYEGIINAVDKWIEKVGRIGKENN